MSSLVEKSTLKRLGQTVVVSSDKLISIYSLISSSVSGVSLFYNKRSFKNLFCLKQQTITRVLQRCIYGMQTRSSDENSVRLSARPSVTRVDCDKTVEGSVQIYTPYERYLASFYRAACNADTV